MSDITDKRKAELEESKIIQQRIYNTDESWRKKQAENNNSDYLKNHTSYTEFYENKDVIRCERARRRYHRRRARDKEGK